MQVAHTMFLLMRLTFALGSFKSALHVDDPCLVYHRSYSVLLLCMQSPGVGAPLPAVPALHDVLRPLPSRRVIRGFPDVCDSPLTGLATV